MRRAKKREKEREKKSIYSIGGGGGGGGGYKVHYVRGGDSSRCNTHKVDTKIKQQNALPIRRAVHNK